jgi:hypothetical protein
MQNQELAKKFAPILLFHPQEKNFPSDPIKTFQHYAVKNSLRKIFLNKESKQFFPKIIFQIRRVRVDLKNKSSRLKTLIQYWLYYTDNLSQIFQFSRENHEDIFFEWAPLGLHCSDYESVTIELDSSESFVSRIMPFAHGASKWIDVSKDQKTNITLYVALNSHAMYLHPRNISFADNNQFFLGVNHTVFGKQNRLDIVDVVDPETRLGPVMSSVTVTKPSSVKMVIGDPETVALMDLSDDSEMIVKFQKSAWYQYNGPWGQRTQQENIRFPPHYVPHRIKLKMILWISIKLQLTYRFVRNARAPSTPWYRSTWRNIAAENEIHLT